MGLLVAVERRAAPPDETGGIFGGAAAGARVGGDRELVRDHNRVRGDRAPGGRAPTT